jgi:hypothetical protein
MNYKSSLCSCIVCKEIKSERGIFSHFLHKHGSESGKERMSRGNDHQSEERHLTNKLKFQNRIELYNKNPNKCNYCQCNLIYKRKQNKFCSSSCAAKFNNINHAPERKFGPTKKIKEKIFKTPKIKKIKQIKEKKENTNKFVWEKHIVGEYSKLLICTCQHCNIKFVSRKRFKYCLSHTDLYARNRNKYEFSFNVYDYPSIFDISLIEQYGWYSPGNKNKKKNNNGVSRDHRISINEAIKNNYDPYYITHPLNCELMLHSVNKKKYTKSSLKYEELVKLINNYDMARGSGNDPHPLHQQTSNLAGCA